MRRRMLAAFLAVLVALAVAAPVALAQTADAGGGGGDPTLDGGGTDATPDKGRGYEATLQLAIDDIQDYWAEEFPIVYGEKYQRIPDERIIAAHPGVKLPNCGGAKRGYADVEGNANYCANAVVYDDVGLFPYLYREFGTLAIPLVLAHEWGHAIQDRSGNIDQQVIYLELQADCFAGSWVSRVVNGEAQGIKLKGGNLDRALTAMLSRGDQVGSVPADAHGSGFDRVNAFQQGYDDGAEQCATYFDTNPLVFEIPFTDQQDAANGGNVPAKDVIRASVQLLNSFYSQVEPAYQPIKFNSVFLFDSSGSSDQLPDCGLTRAQLKNRVFVCLDDNTVLFDEPYLQHVYDDIGDMGVATLLAGPFATYVQTLQDFPGAADNADNAVLGADCYTGGFANALYRQLLSSDTLGLAVGDPILSPGDLDETVQAFIDYSAARGIKDLDVTFVRLRAFRDGFFNGYGVCQTNYASASLDQSSG